MIFVNLFCTIMVVHNVFAHHLGLCTRARCICSLIVLMLTYDMIAVNHRRRLQHQSDLSPHQGSMDYCPYHTL